MRDGWVESSFGEVFNIQQGKTLAINKLKGGEYPVYGANGIVGHYHEFNFDFPLTGLGCRGSCGTIYYIENKAFLANNVMAIWEKDSTKIDSRFIPLALSHIDLIASGAISGQVQPQITKQGLEPVRIKIPPLSEQKRIVDLTSALDLYIKALHDQFESVKKLRDAVLFESITSIGDDWLLTTLGNVADWGSGGTPKADNPEFYEGDIPWCVIGDLTEGEVWKTEKKITKLGLKNSSARVIEPGTVLLAMYGASIGRTGISAIPMATNQAIAFARCKTELVLPKYLLAYLQSQKTKFVEMGQGAAQPNISQTIIKSWSITVPPISFQLELISRIGFFDTQLLNLGGTINASKTMRSSLLADLLTGEHEIPESYDKVIGARK
jgi:restriction endonuclease S subunit